MLARPRAIFPRGKGFQWRFRSATSGIVKALWSTPLKRFSRVEEGRGGCAPRRPLRFPSPLIKPDVLISSIRLSDRLHRTTHGERPLCVHIRCRTASSPNTSPKENREAPRLLTLCRLQRKFCTRS
jgi:hypothetical protein